MNFLSKPKTYYIMQKKVYNYSLLALLAFIGFFYTNCKKEEVPVNKTESFIITYEQTPFQSRFDKALIVSKIDGEVAHYQLLPLISSPQTITIELQKAVDEQFALTIIRQREINYNNNKLISYPNLTYTNLKSNTIIQSDPYTPPRPYRDSVEVVIHNIDVVNELKINGHLSGHIPDTLQGNTLTLRYIKYDEYAVYFLLRANDEETPRYFYANNELGQNKFTINYEDLKTDVTAQNVFINNGNWRGQIVATDIATNNKIAFYDHRPVSSSINDNTNTLNFWLPSNLQLSNYELDLWSSIRPSLRINKQIENLPEFIETPFNSFLMLHARQNGFAFEPSFDFGANKTMDYYIATYSFLPTTNNTFSYYWTIVGPFEPVVQFLLPNIPPEVIDAVDGLETLSNPNQLQIESVRMDASIPSSFWETPSIIFDEQWQKEKGLNGTKLIQLL